MLYFCWGYRIKEDIFGYPIPDPNDMKPIEPKFPKGPPDFKSFDDYVEFTAKE